MGQTDGAKPGKHKFSFYGGVGPNYYINNLVLSKDLVRPFNYSFVGRFMWEPEHFLSLGLESGYYMLYQLTATQDQTTWHISNAAVPIQLVVSMKFLKSFYFNFSFGRSLLLNKVSTSNIGSFDATSFSLADFTETLGYKIKLKHRFSIGAEAKFYYASRLEDKNFALVFVGGYNF